MYFSTSAATLLAVIINLSSTAGINANQLLRRSNDVDARKEPRKLYGWGQGTTTDVQTDCEEVVTGYPEVCILVCTEVTSTMKGDELVNEYSSVSQQKCDGYEDEDGWQSGGLLGSVSSDYSKSSKSKSVGGFGSGSSSGSKSSKSKSGGSGSYSGSKSSKSGDAGSYSGSSKSSKSGSGYTKSSKGSGSYSKSSKSGGDGAGSVDTASEWGATIVRAGPNEWSASWSNGNHYPNPNIKQGGYSKSSKGSGSYSKSSKSDGVSGYSKSSKGSDFYSKGSKSGGGGSASEDTGYSKSSKSGGGGFGSAGNAWSAPIEWVSTPDGSDSVAGGW